MSTLDKFGDAIKKRLRELDRREWIDSGFYDYGDPTGAGCYVEVDWAKLDAEIDALCAEFKAKQP